MVVGIGGVIHCNRYCVCGNCGLRETASRWTKVFGSLFLRFAGEGLCDVEFCLEEVGVSWIWCQDAGDCWGSGGVRSLIVCGVGAISLLLLWSHCF